MTTPTNPFIASASLVRANMLRESCFNRACAQCFAERCAYKLKRNVTRANLPWGLVHLGSSAVLSWAWQQWSTRGLKAVTHG